MSEAAKSVLLAFADDEHLIGQQHTEWIGVAPFLEEDLAFASIAQDELGHAVLLYECVLGLDGLGTEDEAVDTLAFGRQPGDYRSCAFAEYVTTDWAEALVRHWIYDCFEALRWETFSDSSVAEVAAIVPRAEREEVFHRRHADALLDALLGTLEAGDRLRGALAALWPLVPSLFAAPPGEAQAVASGVQRVPLVDLSPQVEASVNQRFSTALTIDAPTSDDRLLRSSPFGPLMARMREVLDFDPDAVW